MPQEDIIVEKISVRIKLTSLFYKVSVVRSVLFDTRTMVKIDLGKTYELLNAFLHREYTKMEFLSPQTDGTVRVMRVEIMPHPDPLLAGVCNLAMGPLMEDGEIDDQIRLKHKDRAVLYSTLVFQIPPRALSLLCCSPEPIRF